MRNKRIGLDLDGVLYPFPEIAYERIKKEHGLDESLLEFWAKSRKSKYFDAEISAIANDSSTYATGGISLYNIMVLKELVAMSNELFYITARGKKHLQVTQEWMARDGIPQAENLYIGKHHKASLVAELGLDVFVDDREYVIKSVGKVTLALRYFGTYMTEAYWKESPNGISSLGELIGMEI